MQEKFSQSVSVPPRDTLSLSGPVFHHLQDNTKDWAAMLCRFATQDCGSIKSKPTPSEKDIDLKNDKSKISAVPCVTCIKA